MARDVEYELVDCGDERRLERFGERLVDRPAPAAMDAKRLVRSAWDAADLVFDRHRGWQGGDRSPWTFLFDRLVLELRPTDAGQLGIYPEHATFWPWLADALADSPVPADHRAAAADRRAATELGASAEPPAPSEAGAPSDPGAPGEHEPPAVLHLFASTGATTLELARLGAGVTHVDASRPAIGWARRNAELSGLSDRPIRWIVDDALGFTRREGRRGRRYDGIVLDPPSYGHGPSGDRWELRTSLSELLDATAAVAADNAFVLLTAHASGLEPDDLEDALADAFGSAAAIAAERIDLRATSGAVLPVGIAARMILG